MALGHAAWAGNDNSSEDSANLAESILKEGMLLHPSGVVPDERDNAGVIGPLFEIEAHILGDLFYYLCNLIRLTKELHLNDELHGRDEKIRSWLLLA